MKKLLIPAALLWTAASFAAAEDVQFGKIKVIPSMDNNPPIYCKSTYTNYGKTSSTNKRWLVIRVDFTPGVAASDGVRRDGGVRNPKTSPGGWADDVKLLVRVLFPAETGGVGKKASVYGLFTGTTHFWSIPLDGKAHSTAMMVPPQLLDRYLPLKSLAGGGEISAGKSDFIVEAAFYDRNGREIGCGYYNVKGGGDDPSGNFAKLCDKVPRRYRVDNGVFSKDKTPWGVLNFTDYDLVRPASAAPTVQAIR